MYFLLIFFRNMARTNQTAKKSTGSQAPRGKHARIAARKIKTSTANSQVRHHRYRPVRKFQKTTTLLICSLLFQRLAREIAQDRKSDVRFQAGAIEALQHTAEDMLVELFEEAQRAAVHAKSITIMAKDIELSTRVLRGTGEFLAGLGISKRGA